PAPSATATSAALKPESEAASIDAHSADPLVRLTGHTLDTVPWRRLGWGVWHYPIALKGERSGDLRLIKVQGGQAMPEHGHGGSELTLVLDGAYHDELGTFAAGDIADLDDDIEHRPVADSDMGCICLIASDRKARFTGVIGRLIQPITGM
ncbi:MAG: cupin domain-containing protein, partial [Pseudomonadota bacterium]